MKLFNKKNQTNYIGIKVKKETYVKLKTISDLENKDFSEVIEEGFKGKKLVL